MLSLHLPLCPPNHRKDITKPVQHEATVEDWSEYGQELSQSLETLSTWIQEQIQQLTIFIHGATANTNNTAASQSSSSFNVGGNTFQFQLIEVNSKAAHNTSATGGSILDTNPCLIPVNSKEWWYQSREVLRSLVPQVIEDEEEEAAMNDPMESMDEVRAPAEDLSRAERYAQWSRQFVPPSVRIEEVSSAADEMEVDDNHPIDGVEHQESIMHYDLYLRPLEHVYGQEGKINMVLLNYLVSMLNLYYIDHVSVGGKKWQDVWVHHTSSHMSFQGMVFLAIMQARILRQLFCELYDPNVPQGTPIQSLSVHGLAYKRLYTNQPEFAWAVEKNLVIGRSFPIAIYTQSEVEQTLSTIMFKTGRVEWNTTLHHLFHIVSDRMACLFYQALPAAIINVEGYRKPLSDKIIAAFKATPTTPLFVYNFDFLYRCSWRYYYMMQNIMGFEQFMNSATNWKQQDVPHHNKYTRQDVTRLADLLKQNMAKIYEKYTRGEKNTINEHMRKTVVGFVLPQGDIEWTRYKYPIYALNPNNIMEKLHGALYTAIKMEIFPVKDSKVIDTYFKDFGTADHNLRFIHDYLVLFLFDKHFVQELRNLRFLTSYVIPQQNIHFFAKLLFNSHEPYIRQWMGRYYLCYNNTISFCNTDIYQVVAEWILIAFKFCPELWELVQTFGTQLLPAYLLVQNNMGYDVDIQHAPRADANEVVAPARTPSIQFEATESQRKKTDTLLIL